MDHGEKLEAFASISKELHELSGETDYTYRKVQHYQAYANVNQSYCFLKE
jgi:hypothetical protein